MGFGTIYGAIGRGRSWTVTELETRLWDIVAVMIAGLLYFGDHTASCYMLDHYEKYKRHHVLIIAYHRLQYSKHNGHNVVVKDQVDRVLCQSAKGNIDQWKTKHRQIKHFLAIIHSSSFYYIVKITVNKSHDAPVHINARMPMTPEHTTLCSRATNLDQKKNKCAGADLVPLLNFVPSNRPSPS
jgi:hypothetical protein